MSTFEYLAIAFSLVLSFTAMRLLEGLPAAVERERRYWVHLSLSSFHLVGVLGMFWTFLALREVTWTFPRFVLALAGPALYYLAACLLIPRDPPGVASWRDHFFSIRRRFWLAILVWALSAQAYVTLLLDMSWSNPSRVPTGVAVVLSITGAAFASERVQTILAIAVWLVFLASILVVGPLTRIAA